MHFLLEDLRRLGQLPQVPAAVCCHLQAVRQRNQAHIRGGQRVDVAGGASKADDCRLR